MLPIKGGRSSLHIRLLVTSAFALLLITVAAGMASGDTASKQGDFVYVCNGNNVSVLNATDLKVISVVNFGANVTPGYIALSPDGDMAYVVSITDNRLFFVDTGNWSVTHVTTMASPPGKPKAIGSAIAVTPDGKRIYVDDYQGNIVHVIDAATYEEIANVSVEIAPIGLAISPDGSLAYVANSGSGSISVINTSANIVVATIPGGNGTFDVRISPDGSRLYASNWYGGDVMVVDTISRRLLDRFQLTGWTGDDQGGINNMRISPDGTTLYVANARDDTIVVVTTNTGTITRTIHVGQYPREMELSPDGSILYVSIIGNRSFDAVRLSDGRIIEKNTAPTIPVGIAYYTANKSPVVRLNATPTPVVTLAPSPTPVVTFIPTAVPQEREGLLEWFLNTHGTVTPRPTIKPTTGAGENPGATIKPYSSGWETPILPIDLNDDNVILLGIGGLLVLLGILGVVAYLSIMKKMRGGREE